MSDAYLECILECILEFSIEIADYVNFGISPEIAEEKP